MERIGLWARLWLAILVPWKLLFDGAFAARVAALRAGTAGATPELSRPAATAVASPPARAAEPRVTEARTEADPTGALQILAILQREGRLLDFLQEDVMAYADADVGAAARVLHEGCKRGIAQYVELEPVRPESEGAPITLAAGFDAARVRVTGNVIGGPPYSGRLAHHGWQVRKIRLPTLADGQDARIVAPAEVELP